jgi:hypothetical protein
MSALICVLLLASLIIRTVGVALGISGCTEFYDSVGACTLFFPLFGLTNLIVFNLYFLAIVGVLASFGVFNLLSTQKNS